jgi:hypothetical protein
MGIYYCAIDFLEKKKFHPPPHRSIKAPGIFHYNSLFPGMLVMMNYLGYDFKLVSDADAEGPYYDSEYIDITEEVMTKYQEFFPDVIF